MGNVILCCPKCHMSLKVNQIEYKESKIQPGWTDEIVLQLKCNYCDYTWKPSDHNILVLVEGR